METLEKGKVISVDANTKTAVLRMKNGLASRSAIISDDLFDNIHPGGSVVIGKLDNSWKVLKSTGRPPANGSIYPFVKPYTVVNIWDWAFMWHQPIATIKNKMYLFLVQDFTNRWSMGNWEMPQTIVDGQINQTALFEVDMDTGVKKLLIGPIDAFSGLCGACGSTMHIEGNDLYFLSQNFSYGTYTSIYKFNITTKTLSLEAETSAFSPRGWCDQPSGWEGLNKGENLVRSDLQKIGDRLYFLAKSDDQFGHLQQPYSKLAYYDMVSKTFGFASNLPFPPYEYDMSALVRLRICMEDLSNITCRMVYAALDLNQNERVHWYNLDTGNYTLLHEGYPILGVDDFPLPLFRWLENHYFGYCDVSGGTDYTFGKADSEWVPARCFPGWPTQKGLVFRRFVDYLRSQISIVYLPIWYVPFDGIPKLIIYRYSSLP